MFPNIDFDYQPYYERQVMKNNATTNPEKIWKKWCNAKCDVLAMWSHINANGTIFTTADEDDILKDTPKNTKKQELIKLGAGDILSPKAMLEKIQSAASSISS